jgi:hypothetical protein
VEVKEMKKYPKDLNKPDTSAFCGDGSCGCGCDEIWGSKKILSKGELRKLRSTSSRELKETSETVSVK